MEASKSISNGVAKYIKISIIESGTIKVVSNRLSIDSIPGIFFGSWTIAHQVWWATVHSSNFFFYYNNQVLNKKNIGRCVIVKKRINNE